MARGGDISLRNRPSCSRSFERRRKFTTGTNKLKILHTFLSFARYAWCMTGRPTAIKSADRHRGGSLSPTKRSSRLCCYCLMV